VNHEAARQEATETLGGKPFHTSVPSYPSVNILTPSYVSRLDLDNVTIGETTDNPKSTAVEIRHHNGGTSPITMMAHSSALVFHTASLTATDITEYQNMIRSKVMKADIQSVGGFGPDRYGLIMFQPVRKIVPQG
jgi:hypothetical protein